MNQPTITTKRGMLGTPPWMPPEQIVDATSADFRTDIYAIGAVLYFTLTGHLIVPDQTNLV